MLFWIARGSIIGAIAGCLLLATAGGLLGIIMGTVATLPSLGNAEMARKEIVKFISCGALYGIIGGSLAGCFIEAVGNGRALL